MPGCYAEETGKVLSQNEVMAIWSDEELRFEALSRMQDAEKYARVLDVATELSQQFEKNTLQPMYQHVGEAIRKADTTHILFLEHAYFGNTGIRSGIEPVKGKTGKMIRWLPMQHMAMTCWSTQKIMITRVIQGWN